MFDNSKILQEEIDSIINDITQEYKSSGKSVTGNFVKELEVSGSGNQIKLIGANYLEGRAPGQMPPIDDIEKWINARGIKPIEESVSITSLAFLIARKIAREGTEGVDIYGEVVTPQRIQSIIDKISIFNANEFVEVVTEKLKSIK